MRVSSDKSDPGYVPHGIGIKIFLDDVEQRKVITADEELGLVIVDRQEHGAIVRELIRGQVRIEIPGYTRIASASISRTVVMEGVAEYSECMDVHLEVNDAGRPVVRAFNEAGHNSTRVDLWQLLRWVMANRPELLR